MNDKNQVQPLVTWGLVVGAISAASGTFNALDEATANRRIVASLDDIKNYLISLHVKIDRLEAKTDQILSLLDNLPKVVRLIVREEVAVALLQERYAKLKNIKNNILILGNYRRYRINRQGWIELSETLTYLFDYENRLSYMFELIAGCELALAATRNRAKPFVVNMLNEKVTLISELHDELLSQIYTQIEQLLADLNNRSYVANHNLTTDLGSVSQLEYKGQSNRNRTVRYQERVCETRRGGCADDRYGVCWNEWRERQEPDHPFHSARDAHLRKVAKKVSAIKADLSQLGNLAAIIEEFGRYLDRITSLGVISDKGTLYFQTNPDAANSTQDFVVLSADEKAEFDEYYEDVNWDPDSSIYKDINPSEDTMYFSVIKRIEC